MSNGRAAWPARGARAAPGAEPRVEEPSRARCVCAEKEALHSCQVDWLAGAQTKIENGISTAPFDSPTAAPGTALCTRKQYQSSALLGLPTNRKGKRGWVEPRHHWIFFQRQHARSPAILRWPPASPLPRFRSARHPARAGARRHPHPPRDSPRPRARVRRGEGGSRGVRVRRPRRVPPASTR